MHSGSIVSHIWQQQGTGQAGVALTPWIYHRHFLIAERCQGLTGAIAGSKQGAVHGSLQLHILLSMQSTYFTVRAYVSHSRLQAGRLACPAAAAHARGPWPRCAGSR